MTKRSKMNDVEVIAGNVGTVYCGPDQAEGIRKFASHKQASMEGCGLVAHEPVTMLVGGEIVAEYLPDAE